MSLSNKKRKIDDERRKFQERWEMNYFCVEVNNKITCKNSIIKECIIKAAEFVCPEKVQSFQDISLSRNMVVDRISEMADNMSSQIQEISTKVQFFSIAISQSTDVRDVAQVAVFSRGCDYSMRITEELLEIIPLYGAATGEDIFDVVFSILGKFNLPLDRLVSVTTDGTKLMTDETSGFVSRLIGKLQDEYPDKPKIRTFHCPIHQQVLCLKILKMDEVLKTITKTVNFIQSRALNHHQFTSFLKNLESEFEDLPYYTQVHWLSCHKVLKSFFLLLEEIIIFLEMKDEKNENISIIKDPLWVKDLAFLTDITGHLNNLSITLQGKDQLIMNMYDAIASFVQKLTLFKNHLQKNILTYFPTCEQLKEQNKSCSFSQYCVIIEEIKNEFDKCYNDFKELQKIFSLFIGPFSFEVENAPISIQLELIDFQNDSVLKDKFREVGIPKIYSYLGDKYPEIKKFASQILCYFGSTYCVSNYFRP